MSSSATRLNYRVVRCTSEDPEYPVSQLLARAPQSTGWQTSRYCEYPQELGLEFESPVHLRQVQFLSHQSKIATKIELFTALPPDGTRYESVQFKRLGYLSLDNNERSQFQARELKSVYVDVKAQFLRILFHKSHANRFNVTNQVGLIALSCLGNAAAAAAQNVVAPPSPVHRAAATGPGATQARQAAALGAGPAEKSQAAAVQGTAPATASHPAAQPSSPTAAKQVSLVRPQLSAPPVAPAEARAPPETQERQRSQPQSEDSVFDQRTRERLKELSEAKQKAVEAEDYGEAKRCKDMLERVKETAKLLKELEEKKRAAVRNEDYDTAKNLKDEIDRLRESMDRPDGGTAVPAAPPPANGREPKQRSKQSRSPSPPTAARAAPPLDERGGPRSHAGPNGGASREGGGGPAESAGPRDSGHEEHHPLAGIPNAEELGEPDDLAMAFRSEADPLVAIFGDYLTRCLYSKGWALRDAAIQKLTLGFNDGRYSGFDPVQLLEAFCTILTRMFPDKNVQVFLSGAALAQSVCQMLLSDWDLHRSDTQVALEPLLPLLVERLGEANARAETAARDAYLDLAGCTGAGVAAQHLLRPPKKKTARVYTARLQLLAALVSEAGVQPESRDGLPLEPTVQLAMDWFSNPAAEVRESSVKLVGACYLHVGLNRISKYLSNLRQAQREAFDAEFERLDGGNGGLPREAAPPSQPATPSRAADRPTAARAPQAEVADDEDFTCMFCGRQDPAFALEDALDVHYWRACPMLIECDCCGQVVEVATLREHLLEECENAHAARSRARDMAPRRCSLCHGDVGSGSDREWRHHLMRECPRNYRK
eukprot:TRINITY_DN35491_c0_g1_i1.p1 TRINITY_DN35491_c0_g1~~TRINITY_DN35491_c0_g1_i1.p1  ORF type:complete len:827 (+),score=189.47 TRINITY_DN35491_c0_g1_i1:131-2611(+)